MASLKRLEFDEFPDVISDRLAPRVKRLGYVGEFFRCAAHQPQALAAFIDFTEASKGALPSNLVELVALSCAGWMGNAYERNQHEQLCLKLGLGSEWVRAVNRLQPDSADALNEDEKLVQRLVLTVLDTKGRDGLPFVEAAIERFGEAPAVALLMVVGRYVVHALIVNSLCLIPPVPSIFADEESK